MLKNLKSKVQKRAVRVKRSLPKIAVESSLGSGEATIASCIFDVQRILKKIKTIRAAHVNSAHIKDEIKQFVKVYFNQLRVSLSDLKLDLSNLDDQVQALLALSNARSRVVSYASSLSSIERSFRDLEVQQLILQSNTLIREKGVSQNNSINEQDQKILDVLSKTLPLSFLSYQQVVVDIKTHRISYKGTAAELREVLREVLDYLAPDKDVVAIAGFKFERDLSKPTMKQKVRYILKNRNKSASAIEVPENSASIVEESIAKLARATYNRGSLSTHSETERVEIITLKRYLDSILCELLEVY